MGLTISEKAKEFIISFDVYSSDFEEEGRHEGFTLCMNKDTLKIDEYLDENISCEEIYYCLEDLLGILKVVEKNVVDLIISISKTGLPVNRAEFGLYNRYSASEMVVGQGTFENTDTVLTGVSLITKENRFKNIRKFEKYAMCLVF